MAAVFFRRRVSVPAQFFFYFDVFSAAASVSPLSFFFLSPAICFFLFVARNLRRMTTFLKCAACARGVACEFVGVYVCVLMGR